MAITIGVVGQNNTPKDDVSNNIGLKLGLKSAFIGNQNANTAKGNTQYLHKGILEKTYSFFGLYASHIQKTPTIKTITRLPVITASPYFSVTAM